MTRMLGAVAVGALLAGACAPDDESEPDEGLEETDDIESQAGEDFDDADGMLLTVMPACAELGDELEVQAEGLEPGAGYELAIDPDPAPDETFESETTAAADTEGMLGFTATLSADAGIEQGDYELELIPIDADAPETEGPPLRAGLEIVDDLDDCSI